MAVVLIVAEETSFLVSNAPAAATAERAFRAARLAGAAATRGDWIGPRARVTRTTDVGVPGGFTTSVAWVYGSPTGGPWQERPMLSALSEELRASVARELTAAGGRWTVRAVPYASAVNGALSWWQSGEASVARTRDEFATLAGRLDPPDNPTGPTSRATHPSTVGDHLGDAVDRASPAFPWAAAISIAAALALAAWKFGSADRGPLVVVQGQRGSRGLARRGG